MKRHLASEQRHRGQGLTEFALVFPLLLLVFMMIVDAGRAVYAYHTVGNAARAGARMAAVDQGNTAITERALSQTTGLSPDELTVDIDVPAPAGPCPTAPPPPATPQPLLIGCPAQVTVTYHYSALTPMIGTIVGPRDLSSTTRVPIERVYSSGP